MKDEEFVKEVTQCDLHIRSHINHFLDSADRYKDYLDFKNGECMYEVHVDWLIKQLRDELKVIHFSLNLNDLGKINEKTK